MNRFARLTLFVCAAAAGSLAVAPWFPRGFTPAPTPPAAELARYLDTERLAIAPDLHRMGTTRSGALEIACHTWLIPQSRGTIFLVHGFYNHSGTWSAHIKRWISQGFSVVSFDLPGHGLSDGRRMDIDSMAEYTHALESVEDSMRGKAPLPWALVGHSLGGGVVLDRATRGNYPYAQSVLLAPLLHYTSWTKVGIALPLVGLTTDHVSRGRKIASSSDSAFLKFLSEDPLEGWQTGLPWLRAIRRWNEGLDTAKWATSRWVMLQGGLDATVDFRYQERWLGEHFSELTTLRYPQARHHLHNEAAPEGDRVRASLDSILSSALPIAPK